jgi:hypothetical protein
VGKGEAGAAAPGLVAAEAGKKGDGWQRMKECAEQAERFAKHEGLAKDPAVPSWRDHYSPKHGRCYILVNHVNWAPGKLGDLPRHYDELWDAFEGRLLSICTDSTWATQSALYCSVQADDSPKNDCQACREFTKDRMDN